MLQLMLPLPEPILFHPLKHHLPYIRHFIKGAATWPESELKSALRTIGASQLDLYTGSLTSQQIAEETIAYLASQHLLYPEAYREYLSGNGNDFQVISLSDTTNWVLRWGQQENRYVHLHPARHAHNTTRVKAATLRTAIAVLIVADKAQTPIDLSFINKVRIEWLDLSQVKDLALSENLMKLITLLEGGT